MTLGGISLIERGMDYCAVQGDEMAEAKGLTLLVACCTNNGYSKIKTTCCFCKLFAKNGADAVVFFWLLITLARLAIPAVKATKAHFKASLNTYLHYFSKILCALNLTLKRKARRVLHFRSAMPQAARSTQSVAVCCSKTLLCVLGEGETGVGVSNSFKQFNFVHAHLQFWSILV